MPEKQAAPARRRRLQSSHRELTRSALVDAAISAFNQRGYAQTTVDQIADAAGASRATFYLHFRTKAEVLDELLKRSDTRFAESFHDLAAALRERDRVSTRQWILNSIRHWPDIEDLMRPVYQASNSDPDLHRQLFPDDIPGLHDMSSALVEAGLVQTERSAEIYAVVLHAPLLQMFQKHLRGEAVDPEAVASVLASAWIDTIAGLERSENDHGRGDAGTPLKSSPRPR